MWHNITDKHYVLGYILISDFPCTQGTLELNVRWIINEYPKLQQNYLSYTIYENINTHIYHAPNTKQWFTLKYFNAYIL